MGKKVKVGAEGFVRPAEGGVFVKLRVSPGAKSTAIKGLYGDSAIKLSVAAPPVEGKANAQIERYLSRLLGVPGSGITVVKGTSSRDKLVFVSSCGSEEVRTLLNSLIR